ncbi:tRNA (uracil-O(2)-)-methyltransferase [Penicillium macrosclerotiorum]|uniref:tRNA (uracil-O(2)-)-methyltransferase n=1 Tax=Penicillium macrosclerotiorum TaxID=303699 RepID=UPI0025489F89|nr:tRNA (uracil-O(2)-)-methyltransferase [Penicillium macrosclerotiorum]KAJ5699045.1 tRNA (uracil-O(2)-)-methyltransferase [Penicillium macrosclerotiorum]
MPNRKNVRDLDKLSGKPLKETIKPSSPALKVNAEGWLTSKDLHEGCLPFSPTSVYHAVLYLVANPNVMSSPLFRADIISDSNETLKIPGENGGDSKLFNGPRSTISDTRRTPKPAPIVEGFHLIRTMVSKLIPRNENLDKTMLQTCHFYATHEDSFRESGEAEEISDTNNDHQAWDQQVLAIYIPHIDSPEEMPYYYPIVKGIAHLYDFQIKMGQGTGTLSLHFLPFTSDISERLERTLNQLLNIHIRTARINHMSLSKHTAPIINNPAKDNLIPRQSVQNTYSRLKNAYAVDLIENWVENTEPSKHVFEDLAIAAFLIELWSRIYRVVASNEKIDEQTPTTNFPGFVDLACGNGVLVYVLLMEGYAGWGFDARRRKSWSIFPATVQERIMEKILIPKPFADIVDYEDIGLDITIGDFPRDTFLISNHADELTVWTPLVAALACPDSPLPFLAIPCCSHGLSGLKYRYPPPRKDSAAKDQESEFSSQNQVEAVEADLQQASGDLKALRAAKEHEKTEEGHLKSTYGSLTAKTMAIAEEAGYDVEKTLLRIPSTRNMGVVGDRQKAAHRWRLLATEEVSTAAKSRDQESAGVAEKIMQIVERECSRDGGIQAAARIWIERARGLHECKGKGFECH